MHCREARQRLQDGEAQADVARSYAVSQALGYPGAAAADFAFRIGRPDSGKAVGSIYRARGVRRLSQGRSPSPPPLSRGGTIGRSTWINVGKQLLLKLRVADIKQCLFA